MEPSQSEMNILSNGKSHELGDELVVPVKAPLEEDQWVTQTFKVACVVLSGLFAVIYPP